MIQAKRFRQIYQTLWFAHVREAEAKERQKVRKGDQPGASVVTVPHLDTGKARDKAGKAIGVGGSLINRRLLLVVAGLVASKADVGE